MVDRPFNVRLSVVNAEAAAAALRKFGGDGEKALRQIEAQIERNKKATADAGPSFAQLERGLDNVARKASTAAAVIGGAVVGGLAALAKGALDAAGNLVDVADATGVGVEALQEYRRVAGQAGVDSGTLDKALSTLARRIGEAAQGTGEGAKIFAQYGISIKNLDGSIRPVEAVLADVAEAMKRAGDATEQNRIASALLERAGRQLVPVLKDGAAGLAAARAEARALGGIMGDELARKADAAGDRLQVLGQAVKGAFQVGLLKEFVGPLDDITTKLANQKVVEGAERIGAALGDIIRLMADNQDAVVRVAGALAGLAIGGPGGALVGAALPELAEALKRATDRGAELKKEIASVEGQIERLNTEIRTAQQGEGLWAGIQRSLDLGGGTMVESKARQVQLLKGELRKLAEELTVLDERASQAAISLGNVAKPGPIETPQGLKDLLRDLEQSQLRLDALARGGLGVFEDLKQTQADQNEIAKLTLELQKDYNLSLERALELARNIVGVKRAEADAVEKAKDAQKAKNDADKARERAAEKAIEERTRKEEEAQKKIERAVEHSTDRIVDFAGDAFDRILAGGKGTWRDIADSAIAFMRKAFAQIVAEALIRPIVQPIVQRVVGGFLGGGGGGVSLGGGNATLGGSSGGGGSFDLFGLLRTGNSVSGQAGGPTFSSALGLNNPGGVFGAGGLFSAGSIGVAGSGLGIGAAEFGAVAGTGGAGFGIGAGAASAETLALAGEAGIGATAASTGAGAASVLGAAGPALAAAGVGLFAGSMVNSLIGFDSQASQIGEMAGAVIGSLIVPGIGTFVGAVLGAAIGSLFGPGKSVGPGGGASIGVSTEAGGFTPAPGGGFEAPIVFGGQGGDNGFDPSGFASTLKQAADLLNQTIRSFGGEFTAGVGKGQRAALQTLGGEVFSGVEPFVNAPLDLPGGVGNVGFGTDVNAALADMMIRTFKQFGHTGLSPEVETAIQNSAAKTFEAFVSDLQFAQALSDTVLGEPEKLLAAEQALKAINEQFDAAAERATSLGIALTSLEAARARAIRKLTEGFDKAVELQLRVIFDPFTGQMDALAKAQEDRVAEAKALGADLVAIERLSALERKAVLSQGLGGLEQLLAGIEFGTLGGASPRLQLAAAQNAFAAEAAAALAGGGSTAFAGAATSFITQSRGAFASGAGFQAALAQVREVAELVRGGGVGSDRAIELIEILVQTIERNGAASERLLAELRDRFDVIADDNAKLKSDLARVLSKVPA